MKKNLYKYEQLRSRWEGTRTLVVRPQKKLILLSVVFFLKLSQYCQPPASLSSQVFYLPLPLLWGYCYAPELPVLCKGWSKLVLVLHRAWKNLVNLHVFIKKINCNFCVKILFENVIILMDESFKSDPPPQIIRIGVSNPMCTFTLRTSTSVLILATLIFTTALAKPNSKIYSIKEVL